MQLGSEAQVVRQVVGDPKRFRELLDAGHNVDSMILQGDRLVGRVRRFLVLGNWPIPSRGTLEAVPCYQDNTVARFAVWVTKDDPAPGALERFERVVDASPLAAILRCGFEVLVDRDSSLQLVQARLVGACQHRGEPFPVRYVRRYPHRIPVAAIEVRCLISHVRYRLPRPRCPSVVVAAAVLRRHHEHVADAQVSGADRSGARIVGPRPPERRAVRLAGVHFEIVFALRHVGEAGGACRVPAPQPRCHGPYR